MRGDEFESPLLVTWPNKDHAVQIYFPESYDIEGLNSGIEFNKSVIECGHEGTPLHTDRRTPLPSMLIVMIFVSLVLLQIFLNRLYFLTSSHII